MYVSQERAIKNAFASARMEGFKITPKTENNVRRLLSGEFSIKDYVKQACEEYGIAK